MDDTEKTEWRNRQRPDASHISGVSDPAGLDGELRLHWKRCVCSVWKLALCGPERER